VPVVEADLDFVPEEEQPDPWNVVDSIERDLNQAASRAHVAFALYGALHHWLSKPPARINAVECRRLLVAANAVRAIARNELPTLDPDVFQIGMESFASLVIYAFRDDAYRAKCKPNTMAWRQRLLKLRNLVHNLHLDDAIAFEVEQEKTRERAEREAEDEIWAPFYGDDIGH